MRGKDENDPSQPGDRAQSTEQHHQQSETPATAGQRRTAASDQRYAVDSGSGGVRVAIGATDRAHEPAGNPADRPISNLLQRLTSELQDRSFQTLCNRLERMILDASNAAYMRESFDVLGSVIATIQADERRPPDRKDRVAQLYGMMLHVVVVTDSADSEVLRQWIDQHIGQEHRIQRSSLVALDHMIMLDSREPRLQPDLVDWLLRYLQELLEATDVPYVLMMLTGMMVRLAESHPAVFANHFQDIVDIVVGCQLEPSQSTQVKKHCAQVLLAFRAHWCEQRHVTMNLLEQLCEDIAELDYGGPVDAEHDDETNRLFGALLAMVNSVLQFVRDPTCLLEPDQQHRVQRCIDIIWSVVFQLLAADQLPTSPGLLVAEICECAMFHPPGEEQQLRQLFQELTHNAARFGDELVCALLRLLLRYLDEQRAPFLLPIVFEPGAFYELRYRTGRDVQTTLHTLYHRLLALKNVQVLQEAYARVVADLDDVLGQLRATDGSEPSADDVPRLQYRVQFILILLAPLATAPNAIFVTWTLRERPILYVLLQPELWTERRLTLRHYSVLQLACHHSAVNNHFTSSSGLLQAGAVPRSFGAADTDAPPESPTAEHFWRVVCFLHTALGRWTEATGSESEVHLSVMLLLLDWCKAVVTDAASYHSVLRDCDEFQRLLVRICAVAVEAGGEDESIGLRFAGCLEAACQYESLHPAAYQAIAEACCVHGCSAYGAVRTRYITLFSYLPLRYSIRQVNETTGVNRRHLERIRELMNGLYQGAAEGAPQRSAALRICNLRPLCDRLAFNRQESAYVGDYLHELFTTALNDTSRSGAMVRRDLRCLVPWAQWELALQFVSNKLRSPYGRAQDTFQRIEYIVKEYAHVLALGDQSTVQNVRTSIGNQRHARILLGLLEALEKVIYNAAEGTAYALPAPDQSARTFFRVNHATCTEWFSRIRSSVDLIALHCMEPEMAIRYSEAVLRELVAARQTASPLFEHAVLALVRALLRNWESDALHGVYAWCRQVTGRTYTWITMAAEEAAGHRETAATGYRALLAQDTGEMFTEAPVREFVVDQTIYSLMLTCDYEPLLEFLLGEDSRGTQRVTIPLITVTAEQVRSIMAYEAGIKVDASLIELARWDLLDVGENIESNFSCHKMVCAVENSLYGILLLEQVDERDRVLAVSADLLQSYQQECLATHSHEYLFQLTITNHILAKITRRTESPGRHAACDVSTLNVEKQYGTLTLMRVLAWFEFMHPSSAKNTDLRLDVVSSGRKERNYALCRRELQKYYHASGLAERLACPPDQRLTLEEVAAAVMGGRDVCRVPPDLWDENLSRAVYEHCKWLYCQPGSRLEAIELTACATGAIDERLHQAPSGTQEAARLSERVARFLLTCGDWMATANEATAHELRGVAQLAQRLPPLSPAVPQADAHVGAQDRLVGTLLQGATGRCPDLPKAWYALGSWMYRWGQRIVDHHLADARAHADQVAAVLTGTDVPFTTCERIVATLSDHNRLDAEFGLRDALHRAIPELEQLTTPAQLDAIIAHWSARQREVYGYYAAATEAYFRFLQLTSGCGRADTAARSLTVTLRLLRLIVQHAVELREELEAGLATTPSEPWGVITPQLFSRLAHPKPAVQQYVTELLGRVAHDAPHLIVFPVVVGAMQHDPALQPLSASTTEETASGADDASGPYRCFHALRERLRRDSADTVRQVQLVVHELRRISLLWEELWVASLEPIYYDYLKRIPTFETEYYRLEAAGVLGDARRRALLTERHQLLLRPLLFMLEKLQAISARPAETNAERRFRQHVLGKVPPIVEKLRNPSDTGLPFAGWDLFRAFFTSLQQRNHATVPLNLAEVSPVLARLGSTAIAMPGLGSAGRSPIRIRSVDAGIQILQSKTRPKKLTLCGDDGGRYAYLVKGLDDMHLDQCIMQLLKTANLMLPNSIDCNGNVTRYRAEHYSVIPLGSNSGLISWVDKTVPIYTLYSKWLQREALKRRETTGDETIVAARPSDLYAAKVAPLLAERDIAPNTNRREWPLAVLKQVLAGLQQETPRDLLAKELWCHSATANGWWQVTRNYSISLAVMSVLGYIIGLGDRHLNNILVKLATGDIVHIDYNMCFERGKTLRIPEKVPCRLTANLVEALGLTGIEGTFRLTCEHVLKSLKKGRDTMLTLLETIVYDPPVEWATATGTDRNMPKTPAHMTVSTLVAATNASTATATRLIRQAKQELDVAVTSRLVQIRFDEIRPDWDANRADLQQHLHYLQRVLRELAELRTELTESESQREALSVQQQLTGEAAVLDTAFASHPLATLAQRLSVRAHRREQFAAGQERLRQQAAELDAEWDRYREYRRWADTHDPVRLEQLRTALGNVAQVMGEPGEVTQRALPQDEPSHAHYCAAHTHLAELLERAGPVAAGTLALLAEYAVGRDTRLTVGEHPWRLFRGWYLALADVSPEPTVAVDAVRDLQRAQTAELARMEPTERRTQINEACRALAEMERTVIHAADTGDITVHLQQLSAAVEDLQHLCTGWIEEKGTHEALQAVRDGYDALEQFARTGTEALRTGESLGGASTTNERALQLSEQYELLVRNVEHCLRTETGDSERGAAVREATVLARVLVAGWHQLLSAEQTLSDLQELALDTRLPETVAPPDHQPNRTTWLRTVRDELLPVLAISKIGDAPEMVESHAMRRRTWLRTERDELLPMLGVWDAEQTGAAREELEQLIACLLEAALSEFLFDATVASLDRLVRQLVRLRLAGRATKAALYFLHRAPGAHDPWLAQLTDSVRALDELRPLLQAALDQWRDRTAALRNCLAWASAAHPPLCPPAVPGAFERASAARADATTDWLRAFDAAHRHARAVQRYERLRHCHDLADLSAALAAAGNRWRRKLAGIGPRAAITPTEELLVQLLDPEGATDRAWVSNLRALLDDMTDQLLTRIDRLERHEQTLQAALHAAGSRLVELCVAHENAAGDIRTLLRTQQRTTGSHALDAYLDRYHAFFELVRNVHRAIRTMTRRPDAESARAPAARTNPSSLGEVRRMVADLIDRLPGVFEQLFQFGALEASPLSNTPAELPASRSGEDGTRGDRLAADTMPEDVATQESQPVITSQCVQQLRNPHAVSVCDRIRRKLDGYDPDPAQRSSEQEQVDWIIKEAMDQGNLARLYHGWTPWV